MEERETGRSATGRMPPSLLAPRETLLGWSAVSDAADIIQAWDTHTSGTLVYACVLQTVTSYNYL